MRLTHYLTEAKEIDPEEIDELIDKNCKPILKELKGHILYRGIKKLHSPCYKIQTREDRKPTDTPKAIQKIFDDICQNLYGWKPRASGLFVSGDKFQANAYGNIYTIWPIGNFKFIWSAKIRDFYTTLKYEVIKYREDRESEAIKVNIGEYMRFLNLSNSDIFEIREFKDEITKLIKRSYIDENLYRATLSANEIMISCKEYYAKEYRI